MVEIVSSRDSQTEKSASIETFEDEEKLPLVPPDFSIALSKVVEPGLANTGIVRVTRR